MSIKAKLGPVRFSYPQLFEPSTDTNKYSMQLLIPKSNKELTETLFNAVEEAKADGVAKLGKNTKNVRIPVHDGDGQKPNGGEYAPECKGHYVMNVSSKIAPQVIVGRERVPATEADIRPGDYGYVSVAFSAYNNNGNKGVGAYMNNVWKTKDGKPLGGARPTAEEDFGSMDVDSIDFDIIEVDPLTGAPLGGDTLADSDFSPLPD